MWNYIGDIIEKVDQQENQDRRMNVLIHGVKEDPNGESWEGSKKRTLEVFEKANFKLEPALIQRAHRLHGRNRPRIMIIKFVQYADREKALKFGKTIPDIRITEDYSQLVRQKRNVLAPLQKAAYERRLRTLYLKDRLIVDKTSFTVDPFLEKTTAHLPDGNRKIIKDMDDFWQCFSERGRYFNNGNSNKRPRSQTSPFASLSPSTQPAQGKGLRLADNSEQQDDYY